MHDALLFDLDGTLIDTESIARTTGRSAFASLGLAADDAFLHSLIGRDEPASARLIAQAFPGADLVALRQEWQAAFRAAIAVDLPLKPGVTELMALTEGLPRAIVTSTERDGAHRKLGIAGLADAFACVVTLNDVQSPKPAPDPYLLAARLLGASPARCLVFEDSETGAESAWRAGCVVVQVPDLVPSQGQWAHHLAPDLMTGARMAGLLG